MSKQQNPLIREENRRFPSHAREASQPAGTRCCCFSKFSSNGAQLSSPCSHGIATNPSRKALGPPSPFPSLFHQCRALHSPTAASQRRWGRLGAPGVADPALPGLETPAPAPGLHQGPSGHGHSPAWPPGHILPVPATSPSSDRPLGPPGTATTPTCCHKARSVPPPRAQAVPHVEVT